MKWIALDIFVGFLIVFGVVAFAFALLAGNFFSAMFKVLFLSGLLLFYPYLKARIRDAEKFLKEHEHTKFRKDLHAK